MVMMMLGVELVLAKLIILSQWILLEWLLLRLILVLLELRVNLLWLIEVLRVVEVRIAANVPKFTLIVVAMMMLLVMFRILTVEVRVILSGFKIVAHLRHRLWLNLHKNKKCVSLL